MASLCLCVNVDHVATLRQARREKEPDPVLAARSALAAGAKGVTVHLREDRRHIQPEDVRRLRREKIFLNLEMAPVEPMVRFALRLRPDQVTLVPEKRRELTTEGGLNLRKRRLPEIVRRLKKAKIKVSLFINADLEAVERAARLEADFIELHTGPYARAFRRGGARAAKPFLEKLRKCAQKAYHLGLGVHAGHGLTTENVGAVSKIPYLQDLNVGHHLVSQAVLLGFPSAVRAFLRACAKRKR